jgi:hypothetical protein
MANQQDLEKHAKAFRKAWDKVRGEIAWLKLAKYNVEVSGWETSVDGRTISDCPKVKIYKLTEENI